MKIKLKATRIALRRKISNMEGQNVLTKAPTYDESDIYINDDMGPT